MNRKIKTPISDKKNTDKKTRAPLENIVYTTGDVAKILELSIHKIICCFGEGLLNGYYAGTHRRIPYNNLVEFMKEYNLYEFFKDRLDDYGK